MTTLIQAVLQVFFIQEILYVFWKRPLSSGETQAASSLRGKIMTDYKMPIGSVSFRSLREHQEYYVDKTGFISELLTENTARTAVITRPRRFGKSLNITMLRDFLDCTKNSRELFEGLAISEDSAICDKWMNRHPVLYLPLNSIKTYTFDGVTRRFAAFASRLCQEHSAVLKCKDVPEQTKKILASILERTAPMEDLLDLLLLLSQALFAMYQKKPVILIDEYDAPFSPLTAEDDQIRLADFMGSLFETGLKTNEYFAFAVLTGCLRITKENIFTGLNNFKCYGISDAVFADKFGFTSDEVDHLLADTNLTHKKNALRRWYDGYCFGSGIKMYCPWDIMNYLQDLKKAPKLPPQKYWVHSSGNDLVRKCIDFMDVMPVGKKIAKLIQGGSVSQSLREEMTYRDLYSSEDALWTLLYTTGYLTRVSCTEKWSDSEEVALRIPNREVYTIFRDDISAWFKDLPEKTDLAALVNAFWNGDEQEVSQALSAALLCKTSFHDGTHGGKEGFYHAWLLGLFASSRFELTSNIESGQGRPDILIDDEKKKRSIVIEIKYTNRKTQLSTEADKALNQIAENQYDAPLLAKKRSVIRWGLAFSQKQCLAKCLTKVQ